TLTVTIDGLVVCTITVSQDGSWSCTPTTPLADGNHPVTITVTDAAGNRSTMSMTVTVNTQALALPTINPIARPAPGQFGFNRYPIITGTAPGATTVTVTIDPDRDLATDNSVAYSVPVGADGIWSLDTTTATPISGTLPTEGFTITQKVDVTAVARDEAGMVSPMASQIVTIAYTILLPIIATP
ncbi:MAG: Ig-like domain-containing protein, partial [Roseiflexaceae bacterium]|nr:Ig-like domain-containing protein [Roseiflexaceae bacterium]